MSNDPSDSLSEGVASVPSNPAWAQGATELAGAVVAALYERATSGLGQHVDVSAQVAAMQSSQSNIIAVQNNADQNGRGAGGVQAGPFFIRMFWPCSDGFVSILFLFGSAIAPATRRLMEWVHEEGFCDEATLNKDWVAYTELLFSGAEPPEEYERVKRLLVDECTAEGTITLARFRDLAGTSRRRAQLLLERFDVDRLTLRTGDARRLRRSALGRAGEHWLDPARERVVEVGAQVTI